MGTHKAARFSSLFLVLIALLLLVPATERTVTAQPFTYTVVQTDLPRIAYGSIALADVENDGDLDVLLMGSTTAQAPFMTTSLIAFNHWTGKVERGSVLPFELNELSTITFLGEVSWIDVDNDGDLDFSISGSTVKEEPFESILYLYKNDGSGNFSEVDPGLPGLYSAVTKWADFDNDGDVDLLHIGMSADKHTMTTLYRNDGNDEFTPVSTPFIQVAFGDAEWGDYDNDGDFDVIISGMEGTGAFVTRLYINDGDGGFNESDNVFRGLAFSSLAWGDYDSDGDLDLILSGAELRVSDIMAGVTVLYENRENNFVPVPLGFRDVFYGDLTWGDYDLDGDLDIFLMGQTSLSGEHIGLIYSTEDGNVVETGLVGTSTANAVWGDYDNDLDLDILVSGVSFVGIPFTHLYRNDLRLMNTMPLAPGGLSATVDGGSAALAWNPGSDEHTKTPGLTYNLSVGTGPGLSDIMAPLASLETGHRWIPGRGNVDHNTNWTLKNLPNGLYYWRVQTVDNSFVGSEFSADGEFIITAGGKVGTGISGDSELPNKTALHAGYPNPFRWETTLAYDLPEPASVRISIYDVLGKEVQILVDAVQPAGRHQVTWSGKNGSGIVLGSGVYFARMQAGSVVKSTKLVILK